MNGILFYNENIICKENGEGEETTIIAEESIIEDSVNMEEVKMGATLLYETD